ncbi:MAG: putative metal-binding motif-containing protein, partial [Myxococcota bacterium]|nr:putative metal-binding motif-containing protein [Myxococcota bacterium]
PNGGDTSDAEEVYCDFDTGPGGWTRVWLQPEANLSIAPNSYDLPTGQAYSLLTGSNEVMVAFVCWNADCGGGVLPDEWASFPLPEAWKADFPLDNPGTDLDITASIAGGLVETRLRYGKDWFTDLQVCPSPWNPAGAGHGKGRICLEYTNAPALTDYESGFSGNPTGCTVSSQGGWSEEWPACEGSGKRYAIFARHQPCAQGPATNDSLCVDQDGDGNGLLTDCDDGDATKGIAELCDEVDNDCDGEVDEGFPVGDSCDGDDGDVCEEGTWACGSAEPHPVNWLTTAGGFVASGTYPATDSSDVAMSAEPMYSGSVLEFEVADGQGGTSQSMGLSTNGSTFVYEMRFTGFGNPPFFSGTVLTAGSEEAFNVSAQAPADHGGYVRMGDRFRMERVGNSIQYYAQWKDDPLQKWHWLYGSPISYEGVVPLYPMVKGRLVGDATLLQEGVVCSGDDPATSEEICGGVDEDCDGVEDENASVEICDDVDNDCDGEVDEDYVRKGQDCDGLDADQCENGEWVCVDPSIAGVPVPLQWEGLENVEVLGDQLVQNDACGDCGFAVGGTPLVGDGHLEWSSFSSDYGFIGLAYDPEAAKVTRQPDFGVVSIHASPSWSDPLIAHALGEAVSAEHRQSGYDKFRILREGS